VCACGPDKNDPVRCRRCGHVTRRGELRTDRYLRRSLKGVRHVAAERCEPDEYVVVCPDCGARELFDDMVRCSECLEYPCICTLDGFCQA
jgi:ribosomal protein L37E